MKSFTGRETSGARNLSLEDAAVFNHSRTTFADVNRACTRFLIERDPQYRREHEARQARNITATEAFAPK